MWIHGLETMETFKRHTRNANRMRVCYQLIAYLLERQHVGHIFGEEFYGLAPLWGLDFWCLKHRLIWELFLARQT